MAKAKAAYKTAKKKTAKKKTTKKKKRVTKPAKPAAKAAKKVTRKKATRKKATRKKAAKARKKAVKRVKKAASELLTLTEVSKRSGISMPTLQRYKKEYQNRLPTVGKGRTQRYKPGSVKIFQQIKKENLKKRGRPRKSAQKKVAKSRKVGAARRGTPAGLLSLSEIGRRTGISYPTLLRYVRLYGSRIPSRGSGRKRRFPVEAVPVFQQLRKESRRGRRKGSVAKKAAAGGRRATAARLRSLDRRMARLEKQIQALVRALKRPLVRGI